MKSIEKFLIKAALFSVLATVVGGCAPWGARPPTGLHEDGHSNVSGRQPTSSPHISNDVSLVGPLPPSPPASEPGQNARPSSLLTPAELERARRSAVRLEFINNHPDSLRLSGEGFINQSCSGLSSSAVDAIALGQRLALRVKAQDEVGLIEIRLPGERIELRPIDLPSDAVECRRELGPEADIDPCRLRKLNARNASACEAIKKYINRVNDGGD